MIHTESAPGQTLPAAKRACHPPAHQSPIRSSDAPNILGKDLGAHSLVTQFLFPWVP